MMKKEEENNEMTEMKCHLLEDSKNNLHGEKANGDSGTIEGGFDLDIKIEQEKPKKLIYRVNQKPPLHLLLMFALQQSLLVISAPLNNTLLVSEITCASQDDSFKLQVLSANFFMAGLATFCMSTFGIRLPIFQGPGSTYLIPLLVLQSLDEWKCPDTFKQVDPITNATVLMASMGNNTVMPMSDLIVSKISQISGSLMAVGFFHCMIGMTGLVGVLCRYIGPITIVPTIVLIGLSIYKFVVKFSAPNMSIAMLVVFSNLLLSILLSKKQTPIPWWSKDKGFHIMWYPLHQVFSLLISLLIGWGVSALLTVMGAFSNDPESIEYMARTDARSYVIQQTDWLTVPYPGKFAGFSFNTGVFINFLIATMLSVLDSIGDYAAAAKMCRVTPPPPFSFNRGIAVEGVLSTLSGAFGCCVATVSYGSSIGGIGITRVASRSVFQLVGIIFIICSVVGKFGAVLISIPLPVLGGTILIAIGIFVGIVLSYLEIVDMSSTRNVAIVGVALLMGLVIPNWIGKYPEAINTGYPEIDEIIRILLSNPSLIGGLLACIMDNLAPGTLKERGLLSQLKDLDDKDAKEMAKNYDDGPEVYVIPFIPRRLRRSRLMKFIPIFQREDDSKKLLSK